MRRFLVMLTVVVFATSGCNDDAATSSVEASSTTSTVQATTSTVPVTTTPPADAPADVSGVYFREGDAPGVRVWQLPDAPGGDKPDQSWLAVGSDPDGSIYISGHDHTLNSMLYRLDPETGYLTWVGDARTASTAADNREAGETAEKFHARPTYYDGRMYVATLDKSSIDGAFWPTRGFHLRYELDSLFTGLKLALPLAEPLAPPLEPFFYSRCLLLLAGDLLLASGQPHFSLLCENGWVIAGEIAEGADQLPVDQCHDGTAMHRSRRASTHTGTSSKGSTRPPQ